MSGYDASQAIMGLGSASPTTRAVTTGIASALNQGAKMLSGGEYETIGPYESIVKNVQGAVGLPENELTQYEGIKDLDWRSLRDEWAGPTSTPESRAQITHDFSVDPRMQAAQAKGLDPRMGRTYAENIRLMGDPRMRGAKGGLARILGV